MRDKFLVRFWIIWNDNVSIEDCWNNMLNFRFVFAMLDCFIFIQNWLNKLKDDVNNIFISHQFFHYYRLTSSLNSILFHLILTFFYFDFFFLYNVTHSKALKNKSYSLKSILKLYRKLREIIRLATKDWFIKVNQTRIKSKIESR